MPPASVSVTSPLNSHSDSKPAVPVTLSDRASAGPAPMLRTITNRSARKTSPHVGKVFDAARHIPQTV